MLKANNIFKSSLCLLIAILISFMEVQFFSGTSLYSIALVLVLLVTIPIIYLYFLPKHETMIIFLYNIILVYLLDFLGKKVNIKLFLITLFFIIFLFSHSLYTANAKKTGLNKPAYLGYIIILVVILLIVSLSTLYIYEYILKPNVNDQNQLALVYQNKDDSNSNINNMQEEDVDNNAGASAGGGGGSDIDEPIDFKSLIKWFLIGLLILIITFVLYKIIKYRLWLMKTLKLPKKDQVTIFYKYFLASLSIIGLEKFKEETPYEYMSYISKNDKFPFQEVEFINLTDKFVKCKYGGKDISDNEYDEILQYFYSISKSIRKSLGMKNYFTKYLIKQKIIL